MADTTGDGRPALSCVVFGYHNEDTVLRAVRSLVEQQSDDPFEVIVATSGGDRTAARNEVLGAETLIFGWYEALARALAGSGDVLPELPPDGAADGRLIDAVQRDLSGTDGQGTAAAVRMIWTADHVDVARRLQARITGPARLAAAYQRRARQAPAQRDQQPGQPAPAVLTPREGAGTPPGRTAP